MFQMSCEEDLWFSFWELSGQWLLRLVQETAPSPYWRGAFVPNGNDLDGGLMLATTELEPVSLDT